MIFLLPVGLADFMDKDAMREKRARQPGICDIVCPENIEKSGLSLKMRPVWALGRAIRSSKGKLGAGMAD